MNWNLLLLKLPTQNNQTLLWESFTDIQVWTFNCNYLHTILDTILEHISKKQKNYNDQNQKNGFLDFHASNSFIPLILQPTRITSNSNTLTDNIFSNNINPDIISGNLAVTISDHLPQFAIVPNMFGNILAINEIFMKGTDQNLIEKILF